MAARLRDANISVGRIRGTFDPVIEALPTLGTLLVLVVGTMRVEQRRRSRRGSVVQVAYLFSLLAFPVRSLGWVLGELPRSVVGWDRVNAVLVAHRLAHATATTAGPATSRPRCSLEHASYYATRTPTAAPCPCCTTSTLDVAPGRTVALVGPTGSGKSTLATLLVRLVDPTTGQVLAWTASTCATERRGEVAAHAALVPQQTFLFDDTVRGNITLGDPAIEAGGDERVWAALRLAQADGFVAALPERAGHRGRRARHDPVRRPAAADRAGPGARPRARGCWSSTTRPAPSTRRSRPRSWPGCARRARTPPPSSWSPTAGRPSRSPTRWSTSSTAGSSTAGRTPSCSPATRATAPWSTPTSARPPSAPP